MARLVDANFPLCLSRERERQHFVWLIHGDDGVGGGGDGRSSVSFVNQMKMHELVDGPVWMKIMIACTEYGVRTYSVSDRQRQSE